MAPTRREFLERLATLYAGTLMIGCTRRRDPLAAERVCIHVFHPQESIPAPLTEETDGVPPPRGAARRYFNLGLPELLVCEVRAPLLATFQYFWPFAREDFEVLQKSIAIRYQKATLDSADDVSDVAKYLRQHRSEWARAGGGSTVLFTWNDFTRQYSPAIVAACRESAVSELVLFKDPTLPPYLCEYPARQKGFKRPP